MYQREETSKNWALVVEWLLFCLLFKRLCVQIRSQVQLKLDALQETQIKSIIIYHIGPNL